MKLLSQEKYPEKLKHTYYNLKYVYDQIDDKYPGQNTPEVRKELLETLQAVLEYEKLKDLVYDYSVVCDESNNPPSQIDKGFVMFDVWVCYEATGELFRIFRSDEDLSFDA